MINAKPMKKRGFILVSEAAEMTGKGTATIYRWIHSGKVKAVRSGDVWFVTKQSVQKFAAEGSACTSRSQTSAR